MIREPAGSVPSPTGPLEGGRRVVGAASGVVPPVADAQTRFRRKSAQKDVLVGSVGFRGQPHPGTAAHHLDYRRFRCDRFANLAPEVNRAWLETYSPTIVVATGARVFERHGVFRRPRVQASQWMRLPSSREITDVGAAGPADDGPLPPPKGAPGGPFELDG